MFGIQVKVIPSEVFCNLNYLSISLCSKLLGRFNYDIMSSYVLNTIT